MDEAQEVERVALVTDDQPAVVAQPSEEPFDPPAALVPAQLSAVLGLGPLAVAPMRRDHLHPQLGQRLVQGIGVVGPVVSMDG
jgi:hypothetical protein